MPSSPSRLLATSAGMLVLMTLLTGVAYPLLVTATAQIAFPAEANGSLVVVAGKTIGSRSIGRSFEGPAYFWGRPSAASYDGRASAGSNLGPTNPALTKRASERVAALRDVDPDNGASIPLDLVTSSGSGLDPHISPAAAAYQAGRVARARGLPEARVRALVAAQTEGRQLGVLGEPRVNVLLLNAALDRDTVPR